MKELSTLDEIKAFIQKHGPTEVSRRTKVARRTLHYIVRGDFKPNYTTQERLLREIGKRA